MKKSTVVRLGFLMGVFIGSAAQGQVFNVHETGQQGFAFYAGYNVLAFGQGAASDPGNNIWNGFGNGTPASGWCFGGPHPNDGLLPGNPGNPYAWSHSTPSFASGPDLFSPVAAGTGNWDHNWGNATSAGLHTPITIPSMIYGSDNGAALGTDGLSARTNVAAFIFSGAAIVNGASPGIGTAANPLGSLTLSNVPPGTYDLYLYGANFDGTRGATFIASSGTPSNGVFVTMNPFASSGSGPLTNFVLGTNYVVYNNVTPAGDSTINVTWGAVSNINSTATGEGDFNGLQLVPSVAIAASPTIIQQPSDAIYSQGATATLAAQARGNPAVAYQWYSGTPPGTIVSGQTASTLSFPGSLASQSGSYFVVATNVGGAATSSVANLTILAAPVIFSQSSTNPLILYSGQNSFGLSVNALGAAPLYYYWQANGVTAAITTNSGSIVFNNRTVTAVYTCIVSNSFGTAPNNPLSVTFIAAPTSPYASALLGLNPYAYWPLTETSGSTAYDYLSGNNGSYVGNVINGAAGPAFGFGSPSYAYSLDGATSYADVPGAPVDLTGPMTMITWVANGSGNFLTVAGKGDNSYRTDIDFTSGTKGVAHFNDGTGSDAAGGPDVQHGSLWHQIVGVYDAAASKVRLYVDGVLVSTQGAGSRPGNARDLWIGGAPDYTTRFFNGSLAHVALFNYALTATQIQNLFAAAELPPFFVTLPPSSIGGFVGGSATFTVVANGAPSLHYQWSGPGGTIANATNATMILTGLNETGSPLNGGPGDYFCTVTNLYGATNCPNITLSVSSSSPFFVQDLAPTNYGIVGNPATLSVQMGGNEPFTNQWYYGATPLHNGDRAGRVSGATNLTLTIANAQTNDNGAYQIFVTNGIAPFFASSAMGQLVVENEPRFNGDGSGWTFNSSGGGLATIAGNLLTLTSGVNSQGRSVWFNTPMYIGAFKASFTYQSAQGASGASLADGVTFCVQNDPARVNAVGGGGGSLAYAGIQNSAAIAINVYSANGRGYQYVTGGVSPDSTHNYTVTAPTVDTGSGDPISVSIVYDGNTLALTLTDTTTLGTVSTNMVIGPLSSVVGSNTAIIGFTGATGGLNAIQTINNFTFVPTPTVSIVRSGGGVALSWPTGVGGYVLQKNSSLNNPAGWTPLAPPYSIVGSAFQVPVVPAPGVQFYRLVVTP